VSALQPTTRTSLPKAGLLKAWPSGGRNQTGRGHHKGHKEHKDFFFVFFVAFVVTSSPKKRDHQSLDVLLAAIIKP